MLRNIARKAAQQLRHWLRNSEFHVHADCTCNVDHVAIEAAGKAVKPLAISTLENGLARVPILVIRIRASHPVGSNVMVVTGEQLVHRTQLTLSPLDRRFVEASQPALCFGRLVVVIYVRQSPVVELAPHGRRHHRVHRQPDFGSM